jgi:sialic acid synthase SpsE
VKKYLEWGKRMKLVCNLNQIITIDKTEIGLANPAYIVAEVGVTANGSLENAFELIEIAKKAGADAVKFQTIDCDEFMADWSVTYKYETADGFQEENMHDMLKGYQFSQYELSELSRFAKQTGITFYMSVDTVRSVGWAEDANSSAYKIGSWDLRNYPLLEAVAKTKKSIQIDLGPVILGEIVQILEFLEKHGATEVMLVHCSHASKLKNINLNSIPYLQEILNIPIGYSADTREIIPDIAAISLGAKMIEKRLTLNRSTKGHHHIKALEPQEFKDWINTIKITESTFGNKDLKPSVEDLINKSIYFTSIVANKIIKNGDIISRDMLASKRPGTGISPLYIDQILGKKSCRDFAVNQVITWDDWRSFE